jgi:hypothetical protein
LIVFQKFACALKRKDNQLQLSVEDNGVGFSNHPQRNGGLGQELVEGLSRELNGHLEFKTSEERQLILLAHSVHQPTSVRWTSFDACPLSKCFLERRGAP